MGRISYDNVGTKFDACDRKRRYDTGYYRKTERKKRNERQNQSDGAVGRGFTAISILNSCRSRPIFI